MCLVIIRLLLDMLMNDSWSELIQWDNDLAGREPIKTWGQ